MEHTIFGLIKKCGEIARQHKLALKAADTLKIDLDAMDRALVLCSYEDDPKGIAPRGKYKQLSSAAAMRLHVPVIRPSYRGTTQRLSRRELAMSGYLMRYTGALVAVMRKFTASSLRLSMRGLTCNARPASNATGH